MTEQELKQVKFHFMCHMNFVDVHLTIYKSEDGRLGYQDYVKFKNGQPHGKSIRDYYIDGKWYRTKEKFLEALKDFNPKIIPIRKKS